MLVEVVVLVFNKSIEVDCFSFSLTSSSDVCLRLDPSFDPMFSSDVSSDVSFFCTGEKKDRNMVCIGFFASRLSYFEIVCKL